MTLLDLRHLHKTFARRGAPPLHAVNDVSLTVAPGECVALVGESGSGKSTLGRLALGLLTPDSGQVLWQDRPLASLSGAALRQARMTIQPVFQDASATFNPRRTIRALLRQALTQAGAPDRSDPAPLHPPGTRRTPPGAHPAAPLPPANSAAASASASPSPAPSPPTPGSSSPTNPSPAPTSPSAPKSWTCSPTSKPKPASASSSSPTTCCSPAPSPAASP